MERTSLLKVNPAEYDPFRLYRRLSVFRFSIIYQGKINGFAAHWVQRQTTPCGLAFWLATQIIMTCEERKCFMNRDLLIEVWKLLRAFSDLCCHTYIYIMIAKTNKCHNFSFTTLRLGLAWFSPMHASFLLQIFHSDLLFFYLSALRTLTSALITTNSPAAQGEVGYTLTLWRTQTPFRLHFQTHTL